MCPGFATECVKKLDDDKECDFDEECRSGYCDPSFPPLRGLCKRDKKKGASCDNNKGCESGWCKTFIHAGGSIFDGAICAGDDELKGEGKSCTDNAECKDGLECKYAKLIVIYQCKKVANPAP